MDVILDNLAQLIKGVGDVLTSFFPDSPFADWTTALSGTGVPDGLAWLNWFFPVGDCLAVFLLWLGAIVVYMVVSWLFNILQSVIP